MKRIAAMLALGAAVLATVSASDSLHTYLPDDKRAHLYAALYVRELLRAVQP